MPELVIGLVSTIIPTFNRSKWLEEAVGSVLAQSYRPIEIIISDDGSNTEAVEFARDLKLKHSEISHLILGENRGPGLAREAGRQVAKGEFIQYLDSDDRLLPEKFEKQVRLLQENSNVGVAYGQIRLFVEGETPKNEPHKWSGRALETLFPHLLVDRWWNTDSPLWRRTVCDRIGPWSKLRYSQDWEHDARAGALGIRLAYLPEFVCEQRHHESPRQTGDGNWLSPSDQVVFFRTLFQSAISAGVGKSSPEMRHFSRWTFAQARKAGLSGDSESAEKLFEIAAEAAVVMDTKMKAYTFLTKVLGWKIAGRVAQVQEALMSGRAGASTLKQSWME